MRVATTAHGALAELYEKGFLPDNCRRVVIDLSCDAAAMMYYECIGDEEMLKVVTAHAGDMLKVHVGNEPPRSVQ